STRDAALLDKAALAHFEKLVKRGGRTGGEIGLEDGEHFVPAQAFAIDYAIGLFELHDLLGRIAVASQADFVQADDLGNAAFDHDEGRDVLRYARQAPDHRQPANAAELMHG